jgi:hypothetical protein
MPDRPFRAKIGSLEYGYTFLRVDISELTGRASERARETSAASFLDQGFQRRQCLLKK